MLRLGGNHCGHLRTPGGTLLAQKNFEYDDHGRIDRVTEKISDANDAVTTYYYDDVPELHEVGLLKIEGRKISLPERFRPDEGALGYHREKVFLG